MVRTIPAAAQTELDKTYGGIEVVTILQIFWGGDKNGPGDFYADTEIANNQVSAKIIDLPGLDEAIQVSGGGQSQSFTVVLDDTDGAIKAIFDANDVHKVPVRVWFYILGTNFDTDKFSIFLGQINTAGSTEFIWDEGNRTATFPVVNRIEDAEVGFSADEGNFAQLPEELIGKTWPLCVGTTINVPAVRAVPAITGNLAQGVGIKDFTLPARLALAEKITCPQTPVGQRCTTRVSANRYQAVCRTALEEDAGCIQARCVEIERLKVEIEEQEEYEYETIQIFGGKNFPQGRQLVLNIDGGKFKGAFTGTTASPSENFLIVSREHPDWDPDSQGVFQDEKQKEILSTCPGTDSAGDSDITQTPYGPVFTGARTSRLSWEAYRDAPKANFFWAKGGATVTIDEGSEIIYIANIVPSTIKRVAAWRTLNGVPFLLTVPPDFYTIRQVNYNTQQIMEIVFDKPLSTQSRSTGGGWSDEIFVSQVSSVGSNTATLITWFVNRYTSYSVDSTSFADATTKLENYPMDFALLTRPNILSLLQDLAQRNRCALWMKDDTFFIKYLPEDPTTVDTIDYDDILADDATGRSTLRIKLTKTSELVTKHTAKWVDDYAFKDTPNTSIMRANVSGQNGIKYGTHAREEDYFPFAHLQLVRKTQTFWMQRWSNTWKIVECVVPLKFMKLEPFDAVTVDLPQVANSPVKGIIERATFNSANNQIELRIWTPVRAGEMEPYDFAFPAFISSNAEYPTREARQANEAGSGNEPNFSTIAPPGHPLRPDLSGLYRGFSLACNGNVVTSFVSGECRQDHGDSRPSDIGDTKPTTDIPQDGTGDASSSSSPITNGAGDGFWSFQQKIEDWNKKNDNDGQKSRENSYINSDRNGSFTEETTGDLTIEDLQNLPDPDDLDPDQFPCQIRVTITGFRTVSGYKGLCFPSSDFPGRTEVYVYDSLQAAQDLCQAVQDASTCGSNPPCGECISVCKITGVCDPEDEGEGDLIAARLDSSWPTRSFLVAP